MTTSIVATADPTATPPRVRLDVTTNQATVTLYRVSQDGTRTLVRSYDGGPFPVTGATLTVYDPEVPLGPPVSYTADGASVTNSAVVTVAAFQPWLVHPGVPSRSIPINVVTFGDRTHQANQSVRYPLGSKFPIVASDGRRKAATYEMDVDTETPEEMAALSALLDDSSPLLLQIPGALGWGQLSEYVSVGDVTVAHMAPVGTDLSRLWKLPLTVRARPAGGSQAYNTYGKSYALYPTYGARHTAAATYGAAFNT